MQAQRFQHLMDIVGEAVERSPESRDAWLDDACAGDTELRAEVARLLAKEPVAVQFLEESPLAAAVGTDSAESRSLIGELLGPYRIIREIARGGMGTVYLASRDDQQFTKQVAIKVIKRGMDTDFVVQRFRNERQILATLDHPNIARLMDGGATKDDLPYFIMEYVDGVPITEYCDENKLSVNDRLKVFRTICSAVQYAHQNLVIHRDLKPSNILVTNAAEPKLLDFGIAKILRADTDEETALTQTAVRVMTPQYASPEQVKGERVTTSSDVYSLGVVLYELLTGQRPYRVSSREAIAKAICEQEPTKPSAVVSGQLSVVSSKERRARSKEDKQLTPDDRQLTNRQSAISNRQLKGDLDNVVLKALRKDPERRYASVEQFSEDIRRHLEGLPVTARQDTFGYRTSKFVQRNKIGVAAASIILLTLIGGIVATTWEARRARAESAKAQERFSQVRALAHSVLFDYHDEIAALPGSTKVRQQMVKDALQYLDNLSKDAGNDVLLLREIGSAYQRVGEVQGGNVTSPRGGTITFANLGDIKGAAESFRKALSVRERLVALQPKNTDIQQEYGTNITRMGEISLTLGKPTDAAQYFRRAMEIYDRLLAADPNNEALRAKEGSLPFTIFRALGNPGDPNLGRGSEALNNLRTALADYEKLASDYPKQARYRDALIALYGQVGRRLVEDGQFTDALESYRRSQAVGEALVQEDKTNAFHRRQLAITYGNTGMALLALGRKSESLESCRKSVEIFESLVAADPNDANVHMDLANNYRNLAAALAENNDRAGARANFAKAVQILDELAAQSPSNAQVSFNLGLAHLKLSSLLSRSSDIPIAIENASAAARIGEVLLTIDSNNANASGMLAKAYYQLGNCQALLATEARTQPNEQLNHWREARNWYQKSRDIYQDLKNHSTLSGADATKPDELAKAIAKADAALNHIPLK